MTKPHPVFQIRRFAAKRLFFALLVVFVYMFGLSIPLIGPDEPRYAQVAREMFDRGDFVTPTLGGFHWFEKPALLYWLQIASFNFFGVSEFAARFGPALFGLGTILALYILGHWSDRGIARVGDVSSLDNSDFADRLAVIAASSIGIIVFARGASFDIILTFPMTAALVGFFIYDRAAGAGRRARYVALVAFYFFVGVSLIAKGLVGALFPFAIVGFYHLLSLRLPRRDFFPSLLWGCLLTAAVASLWYLPMYLRHGNEFIDEFIIRHHFQRYTSNTFQHPQPFYFFFWVLPLMTIPWLPFFAAGIWNFFRNILGPKPSPLILFAFAWLSVPLVFFSFSGSKLPGYILPAVPAAIIFAAVYSMRFTADRPRQRILLHIVAFGTFAVVIGLIQFALPRFADDDSVKELVAEADAKGFAANTVAGFLTVSHNAEFYAAGRLLRTEGGKQRRFISPSEIAAEIKLEGGRPLLVLVPHEHLRHILQSDLLLSEVIKQNSELAILAVWAK